MLTKTKMQEIHDLKLQGYTKADIIRYYEAQGRKPPSRPTISVNNGELVPSARSNCTTLPKQEYHLAGLLYRSATALCQRCEPLFR